MTSGAKADGRFGKQDFRYVAEEDVYICPAGERLA
jgi:transposase